jgi:hypothetical protein
VKLILCLILLVLACSRSEARDSVPELAQICGVRIGYDTMDALEHQIGHGLPEMGGHSHSGREWIFHRGDCDISADAFFYYDEQGHANGAVVDLVSITPLSHDSSTREWENTLPGARLALGQARFMGVVSLGMTKAETLRVLGSRLSPPDVQKSDLVWTFPGFVRVRSNILMTSWRAELKFDHDKLQEIRIESFINREKAGLDLSY